MKGNEQMTTWTIKSIYDVKESYYSTNDDEQCRHINIEEWTTANFQKALAILKDFLDVPLAKITLDQVKEDFRYLELSEEKALSIMNYYNGRLAIWEYAERELKDHLSAGAIDNVFCYDIPAKYSSFESFSEKSQREIIQTKIEVVCQNS